MSKRARRPRGAPVAKAGSGSRAAAVGFFALLPIAVAIGVVVGRSGWDGGENEALLEALRNQNSAAVAATPAAGATTAATGGKKGKAKQGNKAATKGDGKVVAKTSNGTVHQVAGFKPSTQKTEEDTKLVEGNLKQTGATYIKAQQNLPDVIVVGGDPGPRALPTGAASHERDERDPAPAGRCGEVRQAQAPSPTGAGQAEPEAERTPIWSPSGIVCWRSSRSCRPTSAALSTRWRSATTCGWTS